MRVARRCLSLVCSTTLVCAACGRSSPAPPSTQPAPVERVTGSERLGWDQQAGDTAEVASFRFVVYVDNVRADLDGASCATSSGPAGFGCTAPIPALTAGSHTIELAAVSADGLESARSAPVLVTKTASVVTASTAAWRIRSVRTADDVALRVDVVASGLVDPTDLAFTPDGRLLVTERSGRLVVIDSAVRPDASRGITPAASTIDDVAVTKGAGGLLALAVDPAFSRTGYVYVLYTVRSSAATTTFQVARLREAGNTFADRVVLLDDVPASDHPAGTLRFGPDGSLYAAFDVATVTLTGDAVTPNGTVLRLNADGSTPADQAAGSPVFSSAVDSPRAMAWNTSTNVMWIAGVAPSDRAGLDGVSVEDPTRVRGTVRARYTLPGRDAAGMIAYRADGIRQFRGDLLVAGGTEREILRIRFDPDHPFRVVATERIMRDEVGPVRAIAVDPGGAIYFATDNAIGRLVPDEEMKR